MGSRFNALNVEKKMRICKRLKGDQRFKGSKRTLRGPLGVIRAEEEEVTIGVTNRVKGGT